VPFFVDRVLLKLIRRPIDAFAYGSARGDGNDEMRQKRGDILKFEKLFVLMNKQRGLLNKF